MNDEKNLGADAAAVENAGSSAPDTASHADEIVCPACGGEGREIVGELRVTRDMAMDAGEPEMEGSFYEYEYDRCDECGGRGSVPLSAEIAYQLGQVKSVEHTPREMAALNTAIAHFEQAPAMRDALEQIQSQCAGHADEFSRRVFEIAEAALAKAEGR